MGKSKTTMEDIMSTLQQLFALQDLGPFEEMCRCYPKEAVAFLALVGAQGNPIAQSYLGGMYEAGQGVPQNFKEAFKWYQKAAVQGDPLSQAKLGILCYQSGNFIEAAAWYRKSAEQGDDLGQYHLGRVYEQGLGIAQNYNEAIKWYRKAAQQGHKLAQTNLVKLAKEGKVAEQEDNFAKEKLVLLQANQKPKQSPKTEVLKESNMFSEELNHLKERIVEVEKAREASCRSLLADIENLEAKWSAKIQQRTEIAVTTRSELRSI